MMKRNLSVVAVVLLLSTSSGCSGMRNFLFGRGAQCGLCNRGGGSPLVPPAAGAPYGPPPAASADCGCQGHIAGEVCPEQNTCNTYGSGYGPVVDYSNSYSPMANDPYSGQVIGDGVIYDSNTIYDGPGTIVGGDYVPGTMSDDFDARSNGIIQQAPMPLGSQPN